MTMTISAPRAEHHSPDLAILESTIISHLERLGADGENDRHADVVAEQLFVEPSGQYELNMVKAVCGKGASPSSAFYAGINIGVALASIVMNSPLAVNRDAILAAFERERAEMTCGKCVDSHRIIPSGDL